MYLSAVVGITYEGRYVVVSGIPKDGDKKVSYREADRGSDEKGNFARVEFLRYTELKDIGSVYFKDSVLSVDSDSQFSKELILGNLVSYEKHLLFLKKVSITDICEEDDCLEVTLSLVGRSTRESTYLRLGSGSYEDLGKSEEFTFRLKKYDKDKWVGFDEDFYKSLEE